MVQSLEPFEAQELISAHRKRYHDLVQNTAVLERFLKEAQSRVETLEREVRQLQAQLKAKK